MDKKQAAVAALVAAISFGAGRLSAENVVERSRRVHGVDVRVRFERLEDGGLEPVFTQNAFASKQQADGGWTDIGEASRCGAPNTECAQTLLKEAVKTCTWRE